MGEPNEKNSADRRAKGCITVVNIGDESTRTRQRCVMGTVNREWAEHSKKLDSVDATLSTTAFTIIY